VPKFAPSPGGNFVVQGYILLYFNLRLIAAYIFYNTLNKTVARPGLATLNDSDNNI
jgi:hypothetical protein